MTTQVGFIRLAHLKRPKSGKPDFGWSIILRKNFFAKRMDCRGISAFTRVFRRAMPGNDGASGTASSPAGLTRGSHHSCLKVFAKKMDGRVKPGHDVGRFFDYTLTTLLTTYRVYARPHAASLIEGVLRKRPEDGATRGVLRQRLATARPGRPGTPPARHYDLAARSSLHGSEGKCPPLYGGGAEGDGSAAPRPKTATVERREASVPRHGTQGASQAPGVPRHKRVSRASCDAPTARPTGVPPSTRTSLGAPPTPLCG